ncbi:SMI1/KNR4 family protein [Actinoplanes sp. NPDC049668]|uniref:SMI1/KNR4 family protein n=1 Tax=unclassified Actinoplanes TaxID=2626549 RepID=UPI0033A45538
MIDDALQQPDLWRPFLSALRGGAPAGTAETEFRGTVHPGAYGGSTFDDGESRQGGSSALDALKAVGALVDGRGVAIRGLVTRDGGQVDIVGATSHVSFGMGSNILESVLLDARSDPEPYRRLPVPSDGVTVSPDADPDAVRELVRRILPDAEPASGSALAEAESSLGAALPEDVRALYLTAGAGDLVLPEAGSDLFYGMSIVALDDAAAREYLEPRARYGSWPDGAIEVVAPDPHGRVQALAASRAWFAIGDDFGGNLFVVDLAPGPRGHVGQILFVDHETPAGARWIASSLTDLLTRRPAEPEELAPEGGLLARIGPRGRTVADVRPEAEVLFVGAAPEPVDLAGLAGHRGIRSLVVNRAAAVANLDVVAALPALEYLECDVPRWQQLLGSGQVPPNLLAAGMNGRADWAASVDVVDALLTRWGLPRLEVTRVDVTLA